MNASVTAVVVNWNGKAFLPACLRSLAAEPLVAATLVVDNGSSDGSPELVARDFPRVRLLRNPQNNYAAANNLAVAAAVTEFVLLLNTDAELEPGAVARLVQVLHERRELAGVMPKILFPDGGMLYSTGVVDLGGLHWADRDLGQQDRGQRDAPDEQPALSGCCALYRRQAWQDAGGLDADFHMYYEDVEFGHRLRARGWKLGYVPAARVRHIGHASIDQVGQGAKDPLGERNRLLVIARHYRAHFGRELLRSPWFQGVPAAEVENFLPVLARHLGQDGAAALVTIVLHLRDELRLLLGEYEPEFGRGANLLQILREREGWIATLLREVARLRIWRLPGRRLKPAEQAFLQRMAREGR